jgi:hypothetical protein
MSECTVQRKKKLLQEFERLIITTGKLKIECCGDFSSETCESKRLSIIQFCFQIQNFKFWTVKEVSCLEVNQQQ